MGPQAYSLPECRPASRLPAPQAPIAPSALLAALGLRAPGLAAACTLPLALTALLFAGPLLMLALGWLGRGDGSQRPRRPAAPLPRAVMLRNWVAAPLVEEFIFRACLISFLLASGVSPTRCIWLSPLLFAASHLHQLYDMVRYQGTAPAAAARALAFQLSYTTLFGWLAAFFFVRTRHLAAAVLPHAFCNLLGPPVPPPRGARHRGAVAAAFAAGIIGFISLLGPLTSPGMYANANGL